LVHNTTSVIHILRTSRTWFLKSLHLFCFTWFT
jgi:hypothetical protein